MRDDADSFLSIRTFTQTKSSTAILYWKFTPVGAVMFKHVFEEVPRWTLVLRIRGCSFFWQPYPV